MNTVRLNMIRLNSVRLNDIDADSRIKSSGPKAPEGAEVFKASDGALMASDGVFYVLKTE